MIQGIIKKGIVVGEEVPEPLVSDKNVLIKVVSSCISAGTEMSHVTSSKKPLLIKAIEQPEKLKKAFDMIKSDGINNALNKIKGKLDGGIPTGYSISGIIISVGCDVTNFKVGDRVAAAGAGIANHAEFVNVPVNLVMKMPNDITFGDASTVALGSIAMNGVRRSELQLGEFSVVLGTGILGMLTVQMLKAAGVRVAAIDLDDNRLQLAKDLGAEITLNPSNCNVVQSVKDWSNGYGADAVLFTAATSSSKPLSQSFDMCKKKGRVILVGVSGMEINREDMYVKELDFKIATSYGPGRYDDEYEMNGVAYPYGFVRWTENRNMLEYLRLISSRQVKLGSLISATYPIERVGEAFESLNLNKEKPLIVLLDYGNIEENEIDNLKLMRKISLKEVKRDDGRINVAVVGAGNFAVNTHLPNLIKLKEKFNVYAIVNRDGHKGKVAGMQFNASLITTDFEKVLNDDNVDLVIITTRHNNHSEMALKALKNGKHVFVEKPLAINKEQLDEVKDFYTTGIEDKPLLMVGFNRRFSKYLVEIKKHTDKRINPLFINYRMNAGYIPLDHWVHEDGGRIIGEGCHIIDLVSSLTKSKIVSVSSESLIPNTEAYSNVDNKSIILRYADGSIATIEYLAVGSNLLPKERMEIHFDQKSIVLDDYLSMKGYGVNIKDMKTEVSDKGHLEELEELYESLSGKKSDWPIELTDMLQTTEVSFLIK